MGKKIIVIFIVIFIVLGLGIIIKNKGNIYCTDESHRDAYPVNPFCTKCRGIDGTVRHECTNPNGESKYCSSCGKVVKD